MSVAERSASEPDRAPAVPRADVPAWADTLEVLLRVPTDGTQPPVFPGVELRCIVEPS